MECVLTGNQIKSFNRSVVCLARVGTELQIEVLPEELKFRTVNSASSAHLTVVYKRQFFDEYQLFGSSVQCSVLLKSVCTVFRAPAGSIDRLSVRLPSRDATKIQWTLDCFNGVRKTYGISCNQEVDIQNLELGRDKHRSHIVVKPRDLTRLLGNFQSSLLEITLIATEPIPSPKDSEPSEESKAVELRSYIDPVKDNFDGALHTQLWIDPQEEFQEYSHSGIAVDVTFSLKEVKAFLTFCEGSEADIHMYFEKAGDPFILAPRFGLNDVQHSFFDATLVLATMLGSQLRVPENSHPDQNPVSGSGQNIHRNGSTAQYNNRTGSQRGQDSTSSTPKSGQQSDHTIIWSELTDASVPLDTGMMMSTEGSCVESLSGSAGRTSQVASRPGNIQSSPPANCGEPVAQYDQVEQLQQRHTSCVPSVPLPHSTQMGRLPPPDQTQRRIDTSADLEQQRGNITEQRLHPVSIPWVTQDEYTNLRTRNDAPTQAKNFSNWVSGDAEDSDDTGGDNCFVQSTPPC